MTLVVSELCVVRLELTAARRTLENRDAAAPGRAEGPPLNEPPLAQTSAGRVGGPQLRNADADIAKQAAKQW